jgi:hypothetical protein
MKNILRDAIVYMLHGPYPAQQSQTVTQWAHSLDAQSFIHQKVATGFTGQEDRGDYRDRSCHVFWSQHM